MGQEEEQHSLQGGDDFRRDLPVFTDNISDMIVEASVKMPLCADFGNGENASKDAANLDEA